MLYTTGVHRSRLGIGLGILVGLATSHLVYMGRLYPFRQTAETRNINQHYAVMKY